VVYALGCRERRGEKVRRRRGERERERERERDLEIQSRDVRV